MGNETKGTFKAEKSLLCCSISKFRGGDTKPQHTNRAVLIEGPETTVRPVGTRRMMTEDGR
jgi:hypothetical protein